MSDKKLLIKLAADVEGLKKGIRQAHQQVDSFTSQVRASGLAMTAAFSVKAIGAFVLEVSKLSGEAEGVREAFDRLPNSVKVMSELRAATHGTVSELDLMKRAVMASNFDISLQALPRLLEFATLRAKQTGQSIDYLVDSIVTGIGRKSKLILDNLGISAVQLTEALGGASTASSTIGEVADAVGKIAEENLKKMGTLSENTSTKLERLNASWVNLKIAIGDAANGTGIFGYVLDRLNDQMDILASRNLPLTIKAMSLFAVGAHHAQIKAMDLAKEAERLAADQKLQESITRQASQAIKTFGNNLKAIEDAYKQNINYQKIMNEVNRLLIDDEKKKAALIRNEANLTEELNGLREDAALAVGKERAEINKKIQALEKEISALQKLGIEQTKIKTKITKPQTFDFSGLIGKTDTVNKMKKSNMAGMTNVGEWIASMTGGDAPVKRVIKDMEALAVVSARVGDAIGEGLGSAISGAISFGEAMRRMAIDVINALERIALANMIASQSKFGIVGIAAATAGFGLVKSLFSGLGKGSSNYNSSGSSLERGGMRTVSVNGEFRMRGSDMVATINNTQRQDGRSRID